MCKREEHATPQGRSVAARRNACQPSGRLRARARRHDLPARGPKTSENLLENHKADRRSLDGTAGSSGAATRVELSAPDRSQALPDIKSAYATWALQNPASAKQLRRDDDRQEKADAEWDRRARNTFDEQDERTLMPGPAARPHQAKVRRRRAKHRRPSTSSEAVLMTPHQEALWQGVQYLEISEPYAALEAQAVCLGFALREFYETLHAGSASTEELRAALGRVQYRMGAYTPLLFGGGERTADAKMWFDSLGFELDGQAPLHPTLRRPLIVAGHGINGRTFDPRQIVRAKDGSRGRAARAVGQLFGRAQGWFSTALSRFKATHSAHFPFSCDVRGAETTIIWVDIPEVPTLLVGYPTLLAVEDRITRICGAPEPDAVSWFAGPDAACKEFA